VLQSDRTQEGPGMSDGVWIAVVLLFFLATWALVALCDRLR
jgi:hypothetical protein